MKAYSQDLRDRVVRAVDQGKSRQEIVSLFGVSLATLKRYLKQRREMGNLKPKAIPGRPASTRSRVQVDLEAQLREYPDVSLERHCELWEQAHSLQVSPRTMSRAIKGLGWTRKKRRWQPVNVTSKTEPSGASR